MTFETIEFGVSGGVATITFNRPDAANALSPLMSREFRDAALLCDDDPAVRAVVLTGAGKMFCAGGDLSAFAAAGDGTRRLLMEMTGDLHLGLSRLARTAAPVIAAVNGTAAGAGLSLVMACDLAIAVDSAVFTSAYTNAGLSPDGSSTFYMPRKIGDRRARELMLTNRVLKADEALDWGIVNRVVTAEELMPETRKLAEKLDGADSTGCSRRDEALDWGIVNRVVTGGGHAGFAAETRLRKLAEKLATGPTLAYGAVKALLNETFEHGLEAQMEFLEGRAIAGLAATGDGAEGISAFLALRSS